MADHTAFRIGSTWCPNADPQSHSANEQLLDAAEVKSGASTQQIQSPKPPRMIALDLMRGAIMIIMAWDHAKDILSDGRKPKDTGFELWTGHLATFDNNVWLFFARWISHFCAPGFFWSMGVAMVFFTSGRMGRHGWSAWQVCKHYIIRGVLLLFIGRLVNPPFYVDKIVDKYYNRHGVQRHGSLHESLWFAAWISVFEVMTGLGLVMLVAGILMPVVYKCREMRVQLFTPRDTGCPVVHCLLLVCSFGLFALSNALLVHYQDGDPENTLNTGGWQRAIAAEWWQILLRYALIPGAYGDADGNMYGNIAYPLIPWLSVTWIGVVMGLLYCSSTNVKHATRYTCLAGMLSLVAFNVMRGWGGSFGNLRGWPRGDGKDEVSGFIAWLNVCKYPPSPAFALLTLGVNWVAFGLFSEIGHLSRSDPGITDGTEWTWTERMLEPFLVFGRAPLFFYVIHFWIYAIIGIVLHTQGSGLPLAAVVPCWLAVLFFLFFATRRYGSFKATQPPDSMWRFL